MKTSIPFILLVGIASLGLQASGKSSTLEEATVGAFAPQNRDDEDRFILPGPADSARDYERNVVWLNGSRQRVQWYVAKMEREHIDYRLLLWAMAGRRRKWTEMYNTYEEPEEWFFIWTVEGQQDIESPVYCFSISEADGIKNYFISAYFNITDDPAKVQSMTPPIGQSSFPSVPEPSAPSPGTLSPSAAPFFSQNNDIMPLGLGIGLGVGVPLILLVGVLIGIKLVGLCRQGLVEPIGRPNETGPTMHNLTFATGSVPELVLPVESRRVNMKPL